jgi:hypothetical protein
MLDRRIVAKFCNNNENMSSIQTFLLFSKITVNERGDINFFYFIKKKKKKKKKK